MSRLILISSVLMIGIFFAAEAWAKPILKFDSMSLTTERSFFEYATVNGERDTFNPENEHTYVSVERDRGAFSIDVYYSDSNETYKNSFRVNVPSPYWGNMWDTNSYGDYKCLSFSAENLGQLVLNAGRMCMHKGEVTLSSYDERRACVLNDGSLGVEIHKCRRIHPQYVSETQIFAWGSFEVAYTLHASFIDLRQEDVACRLKTTCSSL